jgi:hypothetical protein
MFLTLYKVEVRTTNRDPWRNGSASDSRSEGCVFDSRRVQNFCLFFFFFYLFIYLFIYFFLNYHKSNQKRRMYVHPLESESEIPNIYKRKKKKILGLLLIY